MRQVVCAVAVALAVAVAAAGADAQQSGSQSSGSVSQPPSGSSASGQQGPLIDASSIVGSTVRSQDGKDVGKVDRLMVDPKDGRVQTVVISMGGTLGMGGKTVSMPWDQVKLGQDGSRMVVTVQQQMLDQAPPSQEQRREREQDRAPSASPSTPGSGSPSGGGQPGQGRPPR